MSWKSLLKEVFTARDGRREELHILQGPTYPCQFYVGPIHRTHYFDSDPIPLYNDTSFYHRTEDEALAEILRMKTQIQTYWNTW